MKKLISALAAAAFLVVRGLRAAPGWGLWDSDGFKKDRCG